MIHLSLFYNLTIIFIVMVVTSLFYNLIIIFIVTVVTKDYVVYLVFSIK